MVFKKIIKLDGEFFTGAEGFFKKVTGKFWYISQKLSFAHKNGVFHTIPMYDKFVISSFRHFNRSKNLSLYALSKLFNPIFL